MLAAAVVAALSGASTARAQTPSDLATARRHFKAARELEDAKKWEAASSELRAALAIKETPGLRYHLAYCQEQLAHYAAALRNYERAKQLLNEGQTAADVSQLLGPAIERVKALVGELTLVAAAGDFDQVFLDGNAVALNEPIVVDPGRHRVRAVLGKEEQRHDVVIRAGERQKLELRVTAAPVETPEPVKAETAPPKAPPDAPSPPTQQTSLKLPVLLGEGVILLAGLGIGIGFTLQANQASKEAEEALADINAKDPERQCSSDLSSVQSACSQLEDFKDQEFEARDIATVGFVTAGVGAVALIATWLFWPDAKPEARAPAVRVWAHSVPGNSAIGITGSF